jgi:hypothetical protein
MAQVVYIDSRTACNGSCETHAGCDCCTQVMPAEACTEFGFVNDKAPAKRMWWESVERHTFWRAYAALLTFIAACIAAGYLWASFGPR